MDHRKVFIGNENFKEWLRKIDPFTRNKRMIYIGRTLYEMGQRGPDIKAALAQLSQRCQVMVVRLTENEIKHYTRRKPLQKIQHPNPVSSLLQNEGDHSKSVTSYSPKKDKQFKNGKEFPSTYDDETFYELESSKEASTMHTTDSRKLNSKRSKSFDTHRKRQKGVKLLRELFGEGGTEDGASNNLPRFQNVDYENRDKEVSNYLSTTVNVNYYNIYNSTPSTCNRTDLKRKSFTENSMLKTSNVSQKKLRIDVSLSNDNVSEMKKNSLVNVVEAMESSCSDAAQNNDRKKSSHKHSKRKSSGKKKSKKDRQKLPNHSLSTTKTISSEEDPSIKELWSILGMESPTDRTAKFLSNQLNLSSETITLHAAPGEPGSDAPAPVDNTAVTDEPFLKISEPFSLANINAKESNCYTEGATSSQNVISEKIVSNNGSEIRHDTEANEVDKTLTNSTPQNVIETIYLEVDNEEDHQVIENPKATSKQTNQENGHVSNIEEAKSKVGTIRVKSIGLLVDPQLQPTNHENILSTEKVVQSNTVESQNVELLNQKNSSSNLSEGGVEERFFATYTYYFDELVETKISKLGELLHLAIADAMRLNERIKRAEQLSSKDLIKEEKLRADKDFNEMIKIRGVEFSPLCDIIIKRFDLGSKITLFLALFCRILKHAGTIDPANEGCVARARNVVRLMLERHHYKDRDVLEILRNDNDFDEQMTKVQELMAKCVRRSEKPASSTTTPNKSSINASFDAPTTSQVSQGRGNHKYKTFVLSEDSRKILQMLSKPGMANNLNRGKSTTITLNGNLNGKEKSEPQNTNVNLNTVGMLQQTKVTSENRTVRKSTITSLNENLNGKEKSAPQNTNVNLNTVGMLQQTKVTPENRTVRKSTTITSLNENLNGKEKSAPQNTTVNLNTVGMLQQTNLTPENRTVHETTPQMCNSDRNSTIISYLQAALAKQNVNRINSVNNSNSFINRNNVNAKPRPQVFVQTTNIPPGQNKNPPNRRNSANINQQVVVSRSFIPPSKTVGPPVQAVASSSTISRSSTSVSSPIFHNHPMPKVVVKPPQTATVSSLVRKSSAQPLQGYRNLPVVTTANVVGTTNITNTPIPPQYVSTPAQQPPTISSSLSHSRLNSSTLPRSCDIVIGHQERLDMINRPEQQHPRLNQVTSAVPVIVRNVADPVIPPIVEIDDNQLRLATLSGDYVTNARPEAIAPAGSTIPPTTPTSLTAGSSPRASSSPEVTSPTAEMNLPSSSHCHPFIARRPISGKMKMLFGSNSNN